MAGPSSDEAQKSKKGVSVITSGIQRFRQRFREPRQSTSKTSDGDRKESTDSPRGTSTSGTPSEHIVGPEKENPAEQVIEQEQNTERIDIPGTLGLGTKPPETQLDSEVDRGLASSPVRIDSIFGDQEMHETQVDNDTQVDTTNSLTLEAAELWDGAYDGLRHQDPLLVEVFEKYLLKYQYRDDGPDEPSESVTVGANVPGRREVMIKSLEAWMKGFDREAIAELGLYTEAYVVVTSLRETLQDMINQNPFAPVACLTTCLSIESLFSHNPEYEESLPGILYTASRMEWYFDLPKLVPQISDERDTSWTTGNPRVGVFRTALVNLYQAILRFQIRSVCSVTYVDHETPALLYLESEVKRREEALAFGRRGQDISTKLGQLVSAIRQSEESEEEERTQLIQEEEKKEGPEENPRLAYLSAKLHITHRTSFDLEIGRGPFLDLLYRWAADTSEYRAWVGADSCRLLWVMGDPGAGKSTLLQAVVRQLLSQARESGDKSTIAYFFCESRGNFPEETATSVVKSLIWQVLKSQSSLTKHLEEKLESTGREDFASSNDFYAMSTLLYSILQDDEDITPITFVVDAIEDICVDIDDLQDLGLASSDPYADQWGLKDLMQLITKSLQLSEKVKWLVSVCHTDMMALNKETGAAPGAPARTDMSPADSGEVTVPDINGMASGSKEEDANNSVQRCLYIKSTLRGVRDAVDEYASSKVHELGNKDGYGDRVQGQITKTLKQISPGNFLWINMACKIIEATGVPWNASRVLGGLRQDVASLYSQRKTHLNRLGRNDFDRCEDVISTAAIAFRPLSISEFQDIVDLSPEVDLKILISQMCSSFLEVYDNKVHFTDLSARDFWRRDLKKKGVLSKTHLKMTRRCLKVALNFYTPNDSRREPDATSYATIKWVRHLARVDSSIISTAIKSVNEFLKGQFMPWLEVLASKQLLDQALEQLQTLEFVLSEKTRRSFVSKEDKSKDLRQHIRAAVWFLRFHRSSGGPLNLSPQNTFLFCPYLDELSEMLPRKKLTWLLTAPVIVGSSWKLDACLRELRGHWDWIRSCGYSPDGRLIGSASDDRTVRLWDAETGDIQHVLQGGFVGYVYYMAFSSEKLGLLAAADTQTIQIWEISTGILVKTLPSVDEESSEAITGISFSPAGDTIVASAGRTITAWHLPSFSKGGVWEDPASELGVPQVQNVCFADTGQLLAWSARYEPSGYEEQSSGPMIIVWNVQNKRVDHRLSGHSGDIAGLAFSPDSTLIVSAADDTTLRFWDVRNESCIQTIELDGKWPRSVSFSPDGLRVACAADDEVLIYGRDGKELDDRFREEQDLEDHEARVYSVAFSPDGRYLASGSEDKSVRIWYVRDIGPVVAEDPGPLPEGSVQPKQHTQSVSVVAFAPSGKMVASASFDGLIILWDADSGEQLRQLVGHNADIKSLVFSNDGAVLVSAAIDRTIGVWDTASGQRTRILEGHTDWVRCVVVSPKIKGHHFVASASDDCSVRVWDIESPVSTDEAGRTPETEGTYDQPIPVQTGRVVLRDHKDYVFCVAFSPNGRYLASGGDDQRLLLWNLNDIWGKDEVEQKPEKTFSDELVSSPIRGLVFSPPNGKALVSASRNGDVALWNTDNGTCFWCLPGDGANSTQVFHMLSIDPRYPNVLLTEFGPWLERPLTSSPSRSSMFQQPPKEYPYGMREDIEGRRWITWNNQNLIFLPTQYHPSSIGYCASYVYGRRVAIGCSTGELLIFRFSEEERPTFQMTLDHPGQSTRGSMLVKSTL